MATLREKIEAELEQVEAALRELPPTRSLETLSVLELAGTASLLSACYHGVENILKQSLLAAGAPLPSGAAWHRDLLFSAATQGVISAATRDRMAAYMAFRHYFTHSYGFELEAARLQPLVRGVRPAFARVRVEARRFARVLERKQPPARR